MVLETDRKDKNRENFKDFELDRTIEYVGEEEDDYYEVRKPVYNQKSKKPPRVSVLDSQDQSPVNPLAAHTVITVDDLVNELKQRILQEVIDKSGDHNVYTQTSDAPTKQFETVVYKSVQNKPKSQIKNTVPLNLFKEVVQSGSTYEDAIEDVEPQIQYLGQIQIPTEYFKGKPVKDKTLSKKVIPKKHRFKSPKHFKPAKKVRYVQKLFVPSKSKQGPTEYVLDPSLVELILQQPSLGKKASLGQKVSLGQHISLAQQPNTVTPSIIEPQLSLMQQSSELKLPLDQQPSIVQHLVLMKQQIDRLNKIVEENLAKPTTTSEAPQENIEAVEAPFEIVLNQNSKEDEQKTTDSTEYQVQEEEDSLTEEITTEPIFTETSTKALSVPTTAENEQFIETSEEVHESARHEEEHTPETAENDSHETASEKGTEAHSNDVEETVPNTSTTVTEAILVKAAIIPRLNETPKIHTQEFGKPAAGEPIVEKTYNFNAPVSETKAPVNLKLPVGSARKVLLF